jgi:hypothetical protein
MTLFAAAAEGAVEEARAEAIGASDVAGWWMGSGKRRERRALAAEAAVALPLHMAAAGCGAGGDDDARLPVGMGDTARVQVVMGGELGREGQE